MKAGPACEELLVQQLDVCQMAVFLKCMFQAAFTEIVADASSRGQWLLFSGITRFLPNPPIHSTPLLSFSQVVGSNPETAEKKV